MERWAARIHRWLTRDEGQDLMEYGLLAALIATGAIITMKTLGGDINSLLWVPIVNAL
jgi:Flp pilus assembly pilin Flp